MIKHAGPALVTIALGFGPAELTVTITDDGGGPAATTAGSGHGLMGMRERARLYGGTLTAGPRAGGGFGVTLTLPTPAAA